MLKVSAFDRVNVTCFTLYYIIKHFGLCISIYTLYACLFANYINIYYCVSKDL